MKTCPAIAFMRWRVVWGLGEKNPRLPDSPILSALQVAFQIPIIILMGADHNQLKVAADKPVGREVLSSLELEFVNVNPTQVTFLFRSDRRIVCYFSNLLV